MFVSPVQFEVGLNNFAHFSHFLHRLLQDRQMKEGHLISDVLLLQLWHRRDPVLALTRCLSAESITNAAQWPLRCLEPRSSENPTTTTGL